LQKVVIERLLGNADVLCGLFQRDSLLRIHPPPLAHFNHHFPNDALFLAATAEGLTCLRPPLDQGISVLCLGLGAELELDFVGTFAQHCQAASNLIALLKAEVKNVTYNFFCRKSVLDRGSGWGLWLVRVFILNLFGRNLLLLFALLTPRGHLAEVDKALHLWAPVGHHRVTRPMTQFVFDLTQDSAHAHLVVVVAQLELLLGVILLDLHFHLESCRLDADVVLVHRQLLAQERVVW